MRSPLLFAILMDQIIKQCKRRTARCEVVNFRTWPVYVQGLVYADDIPLIVECSNCMRKVVTDINCGQKQSDYSVKIFVF